MLEALNDPYTVYVPPADVGEFTKDLTLDYVGIGVQVNTEGGWLTVVTPLEDSPAFKAGIMARDRIVEVEGKSTFGLTSDQCVELLTGEPGTPVNIVVERDGQKLPMTIERNRIQARTVKSFHWQPGGADNGESGGKWQFLLDPARRIAYIRLTQFTPTSSAEVRAALESVGAHKGELGGLILDLRFNGGGVLQEATAIADMFLKEGVIVSTRGRAHPEQVTRATPDGDMTDFPIAVLINAQSASASEVLAGALTENNRAIAVGTRSFGKGLVQGVLSLPSAKGAQIKITEQRYYLPSGRCIQRSDESPDWGVDPTQGFFVPMTDAETAEMLRVRRAEEIVRNAATESAPDWSNPDWIVDHSKDKQLAAAVKAVQARIDGGAWTPTGQENPAGGAQVRDDLAQAEAFRERLLRELERIQRRIDTLETAAAPEDQPAPTDLWADESDPQGGRLEVFDKEGKLVARLKVTGANLERWLMDAGVEKEPVAPAAPGGG